MKKTYKMPKQCISHLFGPVFIYHQLLCVFYDSHNLNNTKKCVSTQKKTKKKILNAQTVHFALVLARFFNHGLLRVLYNSYSLNITKEIVSNKKKREKKCTKRRNSAFHTCFGLFFQLGAPTYVVR